MNSRDRFRALMNFEPVDRTLFWEIGYWTGTVRRWYGEGLPQRHQLDADRGDGLSTAGGAIPWDPTPWETSPFAHDVNEQVGLDAGMVRIPVNNYFFPPFEEEILEDHGDWIVRRDRNGVIRRERSDRASVPAFIGWPVRYRSDWEELKSERLRPDLQNRLPQDWPAWVDKFKQRDYPLVVGLRQGYYWTARDLLGDERVLYTFHDDPQLVHDMMDYLTDFWIALYDPILNEVDADAAVIWEDISYKNGPLISPAMIREFIQPNYKRFTGFLRDHGIRTVLVDSDGDCKQIIPALMEGGITGLMPFEVNAGMNVVEVRKAFPRLQILGGIDKTQLARGKEAIDRELAAKVTPEMLKAGGYVPLVDHQVPPDVSWEDFKYYRERLARLAED